MYQAFDRATGGRFHEQAVSAATRIYFLTQVNTKHYDQVMSKGIQKVLQGNSVSGPGFFIRFEILAPGLYRLLQRMVRGSN